MPTIRFYIREGLVAPGVLTSPNQAVYDEDHVQALRLVRCLVDLAGLPLPRVRHIMDTVRSEDADLWAVLGKVQYSLAPPATPQVDAASAAAAEVVDRLIDDHAWAVREDNPARRLLADRVATLIRLEQDDLLPLLGRYASAADDIASHEVDRLLTRTSVAALATGVIAVDVVGDAVLSDLRRLAQESWVTVRLRPDGARTREEGTGDTG